MIPKSTLRPTRFDLRLSLCIALGSIALCLAQPNDERSNIFPLRTTHAASRGGEAAKTANAAVEWNEQEYQPHEATEILMAVIVEPATDPSLRAKALDALRRLRNTDTTPQLVSQYHKLREREEKAGTILCLTWSEDPRGLPLFTRILDHEQDKLVRFFAASALAEWNVRRGVAELIRLLECTETLGPRTVRDEAANSIRRLNRHQSWGYPEQEILAELTKANPNCTRDEARVLYLDTIKTWFEANKHRFPDWKLRDPLPEPAQSGSSQSTSK